MARRPPTPIGSHLDPGHLVLLGVDDARGRVAQLGGAAGDEPHGLVLRVRLRVAREHLERAVEAVVGVLEIARPDVGLEGHASLGGESARALAEARELVEEPVGGLAHQPGERRPLSLGAQP